MVSWKTAQDFTKAEGQSVVRDGRLSREVSLTVAYANLPGMSQQTESPTAKPGDHCPLCGEGALVPSPSGMNLLCDTCNRIAVLPLAQKPDDRPDGAGHRRTRSRLKKRF
jgi:hypothetical protein